MRSENEQRKIYSEGGGLAIRLNNTGTWFPCAICDRGFDATVGPELELSYLSQMVCHGCGRKFEPELVKLLNLERDYFGDCPICHHNDGFLNIGRDHWQVCHVHKLRWCLGANLFSGWKSENEEIWRKNEALLSTYTTTEPAMFELPGYLRSAPTEPEMSLVDDSNVPF